MNTLPKKHRATKRKGRHPDKALSAAFCRNVGEAGRYADGNGLYLHVDPSGARRWVQRLVIRGRSRGLGLGSYALVSLAEAREKALENRKLAREGGDPLAGKRGSVGVPTFEEAAGKVLDIYSEGWRDGSQTAKQWWASMHDHVFPHIGGKTVDELTTADIMAALLPIWTSKHVTARKVRQRIGTVMRWAVSRRGTGRTTRPATRSRRRCRNAPRWWSTGRRFPTGRSPPRSRRSGTPMRGWGRGWRSSSWC